MNNTKVMISGERQKICRRLKDGHVVYVVEELVITAQCTSCQKWVHKKCSSRKCRK